MKLQTSDVLTHCRSAGGDGSDGVCGDQLAGLVERAEIQARTILIALRHRPALPLSLLLQIRTLYVARIIFRLRA
jgi:hypothetical protein